MDESGARECRKYLDEKFGKAKYIIAGLLLFSLIITLVVYAVLCTANTKKRTTSNNSTTSNNKTSTSNSKNSTSNNKASRFAFVFVDSLPPDYQDVHGDIRTGENS